MVRGGTPADTDVVVIGGGVAGSGVARDRTGVEGMAGVVGGELTTFGLTAEKIAGAVLAKLVVDRPCATARVEASSTKAASEG